MRVAAIDVGTNTILLLIADIDSSGTLSPLACEQRVPRLGRGVDGMKNLAPDAMDRAVAVLEEYRVIIQRHGVDSVAVCGTSAVRDAQNRRELARMVRDRTGFELQILSGSEEARWGFLGAISGLEAIDRAAVVDIGGGSTELSVGSASGLEASMSIDIGSVRLTERFFRNDPPSPEEIAAAASWTRQELEKVSGFDFAGLTLVSVAGTATTLAILDQHLPYFSREAVTNYRLTRECLDALFLRLSSMPSSDILQLSEVMRGRADVITAGSLVLREILYRGGFTETTVSERGVRYGIALREWKRMTGALTGTSSS